MNNLFIIVSHARFNDKGEAVHGTASELAPLLEMKKKSYIYIKHSLFTGYATQVTIYKNNKTRSKMIGLTFLPFPLRILQEQLITFKTLLHYQTKSSIFIGIDPLNASFGILLKKIKKVRKVVFYTADYADKRFKNTLLNKIYMSFDKYSLAYADQIWNVSSRITALRRKQGVPDDKNFFIPNAPILPKSLGKKTKFEVYTLVIVTHITKAIDFDSIFTAIKLLKRKYKDIRLLIVGDGEYKTELQKKIKTLAVSNQVVFTGSKSHEDVMKIIASSGIGLAIYTDDNPWTRYGDSMKAREYLVHGLPVIINDIPSTADDIEKAKAGVVITSNKKIKDAIDYLLTDRKQYLVTRENAFALAKEYDFARSIERTNIFKAF